MSDGLNTAVADALNSAATGAGSAAGTGGSPAQVAASVADTPAAPAWHATLTAEDVGYLQSKGWSDPDPAKVAPELAKAYRQLESLRGVPADQIFKWPKPDEDQAPLHKRLGVPEKPEEYRLDNLDARFEFDSPEKKAEILDGFRQLGLQAKLNPEQLQSVVEAVLDGSLREDEAGTAARELARQTSIARLKTQWPAANFEANSVTADRGAERLGLTKEQVAQMMDTVGHDIVAEMFRKVGAGMGEDRMVQSAAPNANGQAMTKDEAKFHLSDMRNLASTWGQRLARNDPEATRREEDLIRMAHQGEEGW